jgi:hypothetical protein
MIDCQTLLEMLWSSKIEMVREMRKEQKEGGWRRERAQGRIVLNPVEGGCVRHTYTNKCYIPLKK